MSAIGASALLNVAVVMPAAAVVYLAVLRTWFPAPWGTLMTFATRLAPSRLRARREAPAPAPAPEANPEAVHA